MHGQEEEAQGRGAGFGWSATAPALIKFAFLQVCRVTV
jgi:hypothetical protein